MTFDPPREFHPTAVHQQHLRRIAQRILTDEHLALDVVQETWITALRRPPLAKVPLRAWLIRVTINQAIQLRRGRERRERRERAVSRAEGSSGADELALELIRCQELNQALATLDEPYLTTLRQRFFEELMPGEIAARAGIPVETVRTRIKRGLALLRSRLQERAAHSRAFGSGAETTQSS